jgi:hypothetical protein
MRVFPLGARSVSWIRLQRVASPWSWILCGVEGLPLPFPWAPSTQSGRIDPSGLFLFLYPNMGNLTKHQFAILVCLLVSFVDIVPGFFGVKILGTGGDKCR